MMLLESLHQLKNHTPSFLQADGKVNFLTLYNIGKLPLLLGFSFLSQKVVPSFSQYMMA